MIFFKHRATAHQGKKLFFPIISILMVVLTLLVLLSISTYRHLNRGQLRMEEALFRDGQIILKSLEASFRTGMMDMMGGVGNTQGIMTSFATLSEIHFVALLDQQGTILAHNEERLIGTSFPQKGKLQQLTKQAGPKSWFGKEGEFIVVKRMEPFPTMKRSDSLEDNRWFRMHSMMAPRGTLLDQVLSGKVYAAVGLDTKTFEEARKSDLRHAILMGLILLVLGTAGFYFIFLVQNYYIAQRTLDTMTTYTTHVVANVPDGLLSIDPDGDIVTLNTRAKEILSLKGEGTEKDEMKKRLLPFLKPIMASLKEKTPVLEKEVEFQVPKGTSIPLSISAARLISEKGDDLGAVIILRDLREIKELQEKIKRSERLAGLGSLAAGMAHEIRNPLSSIKGFAQYFLKKNPPGSEGQKYSQVIIQEVERLNRVISNLLDFARPKEPLKTLASISEIIDHGLALIKDDARSKGIQVETEIGEGLPLLWVDKDQLTQVLLNIELNGLDALKEGGTLWVRSFVNQGGKTLIIQIEDNGPGLSEEELSRIFDPFYTTKRTGTGLGLAIAYRIIEKHQGAISVKSKPKAGSVFQIELPIPSEKTNG
jgi:two-component system, NtrC family, sensor histidine kinase HydH